MAFARSAAAALFVALVVPAAAFPIWYGRSNHDGCAVPAQGYGFHSGVVDDTETVIEFTTLEGEPVAKVPLDDGEAYAVASGRTYRVKVTFPTPSRSLVIASEGAVSAAMKPGDGSNALFIDDSADPLCAAKPDARLTLNLAVTEFAFVWDFVGVPAAERTTDRLEGKADIKMAEGHGDEVALYVVRATSAVSKFFVTKLVTVQETVV